jgi:leucyl-tRNA synthetase
MQEIRTCDPDFYKHTQRIFLMLHERGLAYQAESLVNYDPVDKTVLANEQVDSNGCSWRSGAKVEKVMLKQWFLKIKEFQEPLLKDLQGLAQDGRWPEKVLRMQRHWIGKSEGAKIRFDIASKDTKERFDPLEVFTTRADTVFGVQYIAVSFRHPIVQQQALEDASLRAFIERAKELPHDSKEGYLLSNITARNPIAEQIRGIEPSLPVYVAPYVLDDYGSGAVMGVPGHDTRDHAFWRANMGSTPIRMVITAKPNVTPSPLLPGGDQDKPMTERGYVAADIDRFNGHSSKEAARQVVASLHSNGNRAEVSENWRLRDWLISRQRYWGTPIPIIHCPSCGPVPVPEQDLPVKLPNLPDSFFDGRKGNPLAEDENWKKTECPKCSSAAERETDTMDTFMDSSWYFFRFLDPKNDNAVVDPQKANEGMPVDLYVGGVEHAILHLLYARFISKFLASTSTWPEGKLVDGEPFKRLITQGMVHGETFTNPENGRFLRPDELDLTTPSTPRIKTNGLIPTVSYEKMSKSKHNGVDPGATIAMYGADATRAHMLFQAPVGDVLEWDPKKITGVQRWLIRVVRLSTGSLIPEDALAGFEVPTNSDLKLLDILKHLAQKRVLTLPQSLEEPSKEHTEDDLLALLDKQDNKLWIKTQRTIASVNDSFSQTYSLNTIVSDLMTLTNAIYDTPNSSAATPYLKWYAMAHLVRMVAPIAPGVAEEAWDMLTGTRDSRNIYNAHSCKAPTVFAAGFPTADLDIVPRLSRTTKCVVQVDGKRKFEVEIEKNYNGHVLSNRKNMSRWVLGELLQTDEGKEWLDPEIGKVWKLSQTKRPHPLHKFVPDDWRVVIASHGRLCNLVGPKKVKAKKSEPDSAPKNNDAPAAVSEQLSEEQEVMALKHDSNEKPLLTAYNNGSEIFIKSMRETMKHEIYKPEASTRRMLQEEDTQQENSDDVGKSLENTTSQNASINAHSFLPPPPPPPPPPALNNQQVRTYVGRLMNTLPDYLKPRYIPPDLLPVPRPALLHALAHSGRSSTMPSVIRYEHKVASVGTPHTISPKCIVDASPEDLASLNREQLIVSYNAVFPEQLALLAHPSESFSNISPLLSKQRQSITRKLRAYRAWVNSEVDTRDGKPQSRHLDESGEVKMLSALWVEKHLDLETLDKSKLKYLSGSYVQKESDRIVSIWEKIISLWAGLDGRGQKVRKTLVKKKSGNEEMEMGMSKETWYGDEESEELREVEQNETQDWTWLAEGDKPNQTGKTVVGGDEPGLIRKTVVGRDEPNTTRKELPKWR